MNSTVLEIEPLAPLLQHQIVGYRAELNMVEWPSVGSLVAPKDACTLVYAVLGSTLYVCVQQQKSSDTKVRVMCGRTTPSKLFLEVAAECSLPMEWELANRFGPNGELGQWAHRLGGEITHGGTVNAADEPATDAFVRLELPITP